MSWNRLVRWVALAGCSALIGALSFMPGASAHIGASHAPGTTDGPDLRTATVVSAETARVCFDEEVGAVLLLDGFEAQGYDSNVSSDSTDADIDITNTSCVLVDTNHPNLDQATVLSVDDGAVEDPAGNDNVDAAATLTGSTFNVREAPVPGNTDAPEHISTTPIPQDDDIDYGFDEELDEDGDCIASNFGYHEQDGDIVTGDSCTADGSVATISFTTDIQSGNVVRPFVKTDTDTGGDCLGIFLSVSAFGNTVRDLGTDEVAADNNEQSKYPTQSGGLGNNTNDPDLLSIARQGNNQLNYTFDTSNITDEDEDCFVAQAEDGSVYVADSVSRSGAVVTATFDNVAQAFQQIVRASVAPDGVEAVGGDENTYGSAPLSSSGTESAAEIPLSQKPGYSDGPDLEQAVTNGANNTINYCHDEPIDPDVADADANDFQFTTTDSEADTEGQTILSVSGACVLVQFDGTNDVDTAVYAFEDDDDQAIRDRLGFCDNDNEAGNQDPVVDCDDPNGAIDSEGNNKNLEAAGVAVNGPPPSSLAGPPAPPGPGAPPGPPGPTADCPPPYAVKKGTSGDDKLKGTPTCDKLKARGGDDVLRGKGEDDLLKGGAGDDVLKGGPGNDKCRGGPGKDTKISC